MNARNILRAGLGAIALVTILGLTTGGFPSNPFFNTISVNATAGRTCAGGTDTAVACFNEATTGHTAWSVAIRPTGAAGTQLGMLIGSATSNATDTLFRVDAGGAKTFQILGDGSTVGFPSGPTVCVASCSAAAIGVGQTMLILKPADTTRASTVTITNDPDLIFTNVPVGTYIVSFQTQFAVTGSVGGVGWSLGTVCTSCTNSPSNGYSCVWQLSGGSACGPGTSFNIPQTPAASTTVPTTDNYITLIPGILKVTGTSTVGISWAQGASSASGTILRAQSWYQLQRLQ